MEWMMECKKALTQLNIFLFKHLVMSKPMTRETIIINREVKVEALSVVLVTEVCTNQNPLLTSLGTCYKKIEKIYLSFLVASRKL